MWLCVASEWGWGASCRLHCLRPAGRRPVDAPSPRSQSSSPSRGVRTIKSSSTRTRDTRASSRKPQRSWCAPSPKPLPHRTLVARARVRSLTDACFWQMHNNISQAQRDRWSPSNRIFRALLRGQKINHQKEGEQMKWQAFAGQLEAVMRALPAAESLCPRLFAETR